MRRLHGITATCCTALAMAIFGAVQVRAVDIAVWTFETSIPATAGPHSAEVGANAGAGSPATGVHAGASTYSSPSGNGSLHSFSSNGWVVGDYYQFRTSTTGFTNISVAWDQASSNTGPRDFILQYSTDGTTFTQFGAQYAVLANAAPNPTWTSTTFQAAFHYSQNLGGVPGLNGQANVYFRLTDNSTTSANGTTVATGGTDRVDNFNISGDSTTLGACCHGNGFCDTRTQVICGTEFSGMWQGANTDCTTTNCPGTPGACCFTNGSCSVPASQGACQTAGGTYSGGGTNCNPNLCPQPMGVCCTANGSCSVNTSANCTAAGGIYAGDNTNCTANPCPAPAPAVRDLDVVVGTNNAGPGSVYLDRGPGLRTLAGSWVMSDFLQSVEFDNRNGGFGHAPSGNLLALNFGAGGGIPGSSPSCTDAARPTEGGGLWSLSTDGSGALQLLYRFNGLVNPGAECTRTVGLSVSPDNSKLAVFGNDTGSLYVFDYNAGLTPGTGAGASVSNVQVYTFWANTGTTQGTTWRDNSRIFGATVGAGGIDLQQLDITGGPPGTRSVLVTFPGVGAASRFMEVEYNPHICPYVFIMQSAFTGGVSETQLVVIDLAGVPTVIKTLNISTSLQTGRELALGYDRRLYLGEFAGSTAPIPRVYVDVLNLDIEPAGGDGDIDAADIAALTDNSTVDYFSVNPGFSQSFTGMDVALCMRGDANGDGVVNNFDIDPFVEGLTNLPAYLTDWCGGNPMCALCRLDINGDGLVNNFDIDPFVACLTSGSGCP